MTSSVAGLMTPSVRPESAAVHWPSMNRRVSYFVAGAVAVVMGESPGRVARVPVVIRHRPPRTTGRDIRRGLSPGTEEPSSALTQDWRDTIMRSLTLASVGWLGLSLWVGEGRAAEPPR